MYKYEKIWDFAGDAGSLHPDWATQLIYGKQRPVFIISAHNH